MVLELIERVLAALIILGLLVIVLFLAFPENKNGVRTAQPQVQPPATTSQQTPSKQAELEKSDAKPFTKIVEQLPNSRNNQTAIYRRGRRRTPEPTEKRYSSRPQLSTPRVRQVRYETPRRQIDRYYSYDHHECSGSDCYCGCDQPYWAPSASDCW
jgi:cytoskeletal protein RodZ